MKPLPLLAVATFVLSSGCSNATGPNYLINGSYRYVASTSDGQPLLQGRLVLAFAEDSTVTGSWTIEWAPGADHNTPVGPQVGTGTLRGTWTPETIWVDLNPGWADNNVGLVGELHQGQVIGEWGWATIAGTQSRGGFSAIPSR